MKHLPGKGIATRENLFAAASLFVYALILQRTDPEWILWAGPITLGAAPVEAPGASLAFAPVEILQSASYAVLPGLLAWIVLLRIRREDPMASKRAGVPDLRSAERGEVRLGNPRKPAEHRVVPFPDR